MPREWPAAAGSARISCRGGGGGGAGEHTARAVAAAALVVHSMWFRMWLQKRMRVLLQSVVCTYFVIKTPPKVG